MLNEEEYIELVQSLVDDGFSENAAKRIIERSEAEGLFDPPSYKLS